jgi:hypothetical protein
VLVALLAACAVALVGVVVYLALRRRRADDGLASFRRHIDALSPEARRAVQDRARRNRREDGP